MAASHQLSFPFVAAAGKLDKPVRSGFWKRFFGRLAEARMREARRQLALHGYSASKYDAAALGFITHSPHRD